MKTGVVYASVQVRSLAGGHVVHTRTDGPADSLVKYDTADMAPG